MEKAIEVEKGKEVMKPLNGVHKKKISNLVFYICVVAIPVAQFLLCYVYVNANMFLLGFQKFDYGYESGREAGYYFLSGSHLFDNFKAFFNSAFGSGENYALKHAVKNSFIVFFTTYFISQTLSLLFSFYIYKQRAGSAFFRVMLFVPSVVSSIVMCLIFLYIGEDAIPGIAKLITGEACSGWFSDENIRFPFLIFFSIFVGFGSNTLLYVGSMNGINDSIIEACKLDGANSWQEFIYVAFPMIYPQFITFTVASCAGIFTNQLNLFSIYGGGELDYELYTMGYYLYDATKHASNIEYPAISAIGFIITCVTIPITFIVNKMLKKFGPGVE